jgi:hypothetical protein
LTASRALAELDLTLGAPRLIQQRLEQFYRLERAPDVHDFVRIGDQGSREALLIHQTDDALELALVLPPDAALPGKTTFDFSVEGFLRGDRDAWMQLIEGVSHFVYIAERARTGLPLTRLELELQAEVDKFVLLAFWSGQLDALGAKTLLGDLYERVSFLHPADTEDGHRYRLANGLAARFVARLVASGELFSIENALRRFYRSGQADKIRLAQAA